MIDFIKIRSLEFICRLDKIIKQNHYELTSSSFFKKKGINYKESRFDTICWKNFDIIENIVINQTKWLETEKEMNQLYLFY